MSDLHAPVPQFESEAERAHWKRLMFGHHYGGRDFEDKIRKPQDSATTQIMKVMPPPYSTEEFRTAMQGVVDKHTYGVPDGRWTDWEGVHGDCDQLMAEQLRRLGYGAAIDVYDMVLRY